MSNKINLANERRARLAAERILQIKQAELYSVNCNLSQRTKDLNQEIDQTRAKINNVLDENLRVKTDLSAANQRIRIAERRLHHSLNTIRDGFAVFDSDSKLVFANAAYLSIFDNLEEVREGPMLELASSFSSPVHQNRHIVKISPTSSSSFSAVS